jgi:hypothetical protein
MATDQVVATSGDPSPEPLSCTDAANEPADGTEREYPETPRIPPSPPA